MTSVGPHFSVVSLPGIGTADAEGTKDPGEDEMQADGTHMRVLTVEMRQLAANLAEEVYKLDLSSPEIRFLLGSEANDNLTNGPVSAVESGKAGLPSVIERVR